MNTKTLSTYLFPGLILVGALFLAACSPIGGAPVVLAQPDTVAEIPVTGFDYEKAADNQTARWTAMAEFYEKNGMLTSDLDDGDILAYRIADANEAALAFSKITGTAGNNLALSFVASEADLIEADTSRIWEIDADDSEAASEAAETLSQIYAPVGIDFEEEDVLRTWELDASDISAAREAAETLSQIYSANGVDFEEEDFLRTWEIDADDIAAAREAAETLSQINVE